MAQLYDKSITIDVDKMEPMITYGDQSCMGMPINGRVPDPATIRDSNQRQSLDKALTYMDLQPGQPPIGQKSGCRFVGSCTNSRMTDLYEAAAMIDGRKSPTTYAG